MCQCRTLRRSLAAVIQSFSRKQARRSPSVTSITGWCYSRRLKCWKFPDSFRLHVSHVVASLMYDAIYARTAMKCSAENPVGRWPWGKPEHESTVTSFNTPGVLPLFNHVGRYANSASTCREGQALTLTLLMRCGYVRFFDKGAPCGVTTVRPCFYAPPK
jgi:hypothetical protein